MSTISTHFRLTAPHGHLVDCIASLEEALSAMRDTAYHRVLGRDFLSHTREAAEYLVDFHRSACANGTVSALYFEVNGFTINPDLWYFDGFAYSTAGDIWDLDWLASWDSSTEEPFSLHGMETVQEAFADLYLSDDQPLSVSLAGELAEHLVTARYMQLIAAAHEYAKRNYAPLQGLTILSTAHDWDTVHQTA